MKGAPRRWALRSIGAVLLVATGFFGWTSIRLWQAWQSVEELPFDPAAASIRLEQHAKEVQKDADPVPIIGEPPPRPELITGESLPSGTFDTFLIVGSDYQPEFGGSRADAILLFLLPDDGDDPAILSLPRDLYLEDPCRPGSFTRINANLNGCGEYATGPELLALAVTNFTGLDIDHFALFDFEGFKNVINVVGGIEICVENAVFDRDAKLDLNAGCTMATGDEALAWVRSRKTLELIDGRWRPMAGVNDLTRNQKQQDVIFALFEEMKNFGSLGTLTRAVDGLANAFTIDEGLALGDAIKLAWDFRDLDTAQVHRLSIPVSDWTTPSGAEVLLPESAFVSVLAEAYPVFITQALELIR